MKWLYSHPRWLLAALLVCAGLLPAGAWARAEVGRVTFVHGDVQIMSAAGVNRAMLARDPIYEGDTLISAKSGYAQLRMVDEAIIALRPDSVLRIDTYFYHPTTLDGSERGFFFLLKGGFRTITGAIGRNNKQNYQVTTPVATIGIRGTDHEPMYIPRPRPGEIALGEPGVYDLVNSGIATIQTLQGTVQINPNQVGYVADINAAPAILPKLPDFYKPSAQSLSLRKSQEYQALRESSKIDEKVKVVYAPPPSDEPYDANPQINPVLQVKDANGGIILSAIGTASSFAPLGAGVVTSDSYIDSSGSLKSSSGLHVNESKPDTGIFIGKDQYVTAIADKRTTGAFAFISSNGKLVDTGQLANGIQWGRWTGDVARVEDGKLVSSLGSFHYMYSPDLTTPTQLSAISGTATFSLVGGTSPTDERGTVGQLTSASLAVDFTKQQITNYSVGVTIPGNILEIWSASGSGSFKQFSGGGGIPLAGTCTGCGGHPSTSATGSASGAFVGPSAESAISSYNLQAGGNSVTGTAAFQR